MTNSTQRIAGTIIKNGCCVLIACKMHAVGQTGYTREQLKNFREKKQEIIIDLTEFKPIKFFNGDYLISFVNDEVRLYSMRRSKLLKLENNRYYSIQYNNVRRRYTQEQLIDLIERVCYIDPTYTPEQKIKDDNEWTKYWTQKGVLTT